MAIAVGPALGGARAVLGTERPTTTTLECARTISIGGKVTAHRRVAGGAAGTSGRAARPCRSPRRARATRSVGPAGRAGAATRVSRAASGRTPRAAARSRRAPAAGRIGAALAADPQRQRREGHRCPSSHPLHHPHLRDSTSISDGKVAGSFGRIVHARVGHAHSKSVRFFSSDPRRAACPLFSTTGRYVYVPEKCAEKALRRCSCAFPCRGGLGSTPSPGRIAKWPRGSR